MHVYMLMDQAYHQARLVELGCEPIANLRLMLDNNQILLFYCCMLLLLRYCDNYCTSESFFRSSQQRKTRLLESAGL